MFTHSPRVSATRPDIAHFFLGNVVVSTLLTLFSVGLFGQTTTASLNGTATDPSGATVAGGAVELRNELSGDVRKSVTNGEGYFSFTSVPPGNYTVKITAPGFGAWEAQGIPLTQGDSRTLPNIKLKVGDVSSQVEVISASDSVAPVDTGAVSTTLNQTMINEF